ncbi:hypothetical protein JCM9533A_14210 [Catenuloplanes niger JCM 9533]
MENGIPDDRLVELLESGDEIEDASGPAGFSDVGTRLRPHVGHAPTIGTGYAVPTRLKTLLRQRDSNRTAKCKDSHL